MHKNCKHWNKIKAAIFDDIATFNCALCDLIAHLTLQMRNMLVIIKKFKKLNHQVFSARGCGQLGTRLKLEIVKILAT